MEVTYSFIIPTRNIPHLLSRCIDSIPLREDVEIIVVDDNSDDEIVDFDHYPGLDRSNVKVIFSKEGKGAGAARNIGLDYAKGKWLLFADSDDFFEPNFLNTIDRYKHSSFDIIYFGVVSRDSESLALVSNDPRSYTFMSHLQFAIHHNDYEHLRWVKDNSLNVPWGKMINRNMVMNHLIRFDEVRAGNDAMFSCKCGFAARNITCDLSIIYNVTLRTGSLTQTFSRPVLLSRFDTGCRINQFLRSVNQDALCYNLFELAIIHFYRNPKDLFYSLVKASKITPFRCFFHDLFECLGIVITKGINYFKHRR